MSAVSQIIDTQAIITQTIIDLTEKLIESTQQQIDALIEFKEQVSRIEISQLPSISYTKELGALHKGNDITKLETKVDKSEEENTIKKIFRENYDVVGITTYEQIKTGKVLIWCHRTIEQNKILTKDNFDIWTEMKRSKGQGRTQQALSRHTLYTKID